MGFSSVLFLVEDCQEISVRNYGGVAFPCDIAYTLSFGNTTIKHFHANGFEK